MVQKLERKTDT